MQAIKCLPQEQVSTGKNKRIRYSFEASTRCNAVGNTR